MAFDVVRKLHFFTAYLFLSDDCEVLQTLISEVRPRAQSRPS
jgi:hypothetical protein